MCELVVVERVVLGVVLGNVRHTCQLDDVVVGDVPVDLRRPARIFIGVLVPTAGQVGRAGVGRVAGAGAVSLGELAVDEEEQLVLDDRAADIGTGGVLPGVVLVAVLIQLAIGLVSRAARIIGGEVAGVGVIHVARRCAQRFRAPDLVRTGLPFVGAATGHDVDHATGGAPKVRAIAAGEDLFLGDGLKGQCGRADAGQRVGYRKAVDVIGILRRSRTAEAGYAAVAVAGDRTGCQQGNSSDVARQRKAAQVFVAEDGPGIDLRNVDRCHRRGAHHDAVQISRLAAGEGDLGAGGDVDRHVILCRDRGAVTAQFHRVAAVGQVGHAVTTIGINRQGARGAGPQVADNHARTRAGRRLAVDVTGHGLSVGDREKATRQGGSQRRAAPELRLHQDSLRGVVGAPRGQTGTRSQTACLIYKCLVNKNAMNPE